MAFSTITYEVDGHTATLTPNRPAALNALSPHLAKPVPAALRTGLRERLSAYKIAQRFVTVAPAAP